MLDVKVTLSVSAVVVVVDDAAYNIISDLGATEGSLTRRLGLGLLDDARFAPSSVGLGSGVRTVLHIFARLLLLLLLLSTVMMLLLLLVMMLLDHVCH